MSFTDDLERARRARLPRMALRPDDLRPDVPDAMDDVVIAQPEMVRAELANDDELWMACRFPNGEEVRFSVTVANGGLDWRVIETPAEWIDIDKAEWIDIDKKDGMGNA